MHIKPLINLLQLISKVQLGLKTFKNDQVQLLVLDQSTLDLNCTTFTVPNISMPTRKECLENLRKT